MSIQLSSKHEMGRMEAVSPDDYDEFANPADFRRPPTRPLSERLKNQLKTLPVFPIGMAGFVSIAGYGIYKYQSLPLNDSIAKTVYFTRLRIIAQGFAVGVISLGALHAWFNDRSYARTHNGQLPPRHQ